MRCVVFYNSTLFNPFLSLLSSIVVNSYGFVDYMIVSVNKEKTLHDPVFFADEKEPPKDEGILAELHFVDMRSKSCNTNQHKSGFYEKR